MKPDQAETTLEEGFLRAMREEPDNEGHALVLADWLDEQGDPRGELVRVQLALRKASVVAERQALEERMQGLLAAGVRPCVPTLVNSVGMRLAFIPAGTFWMGSQQSEDGRDDDEGPLHPVMIGRPFFLGVCPVTLRDWYRVLREPPPVGTELWDCPAEGIAWGEAVRFCDQLSELPEERQARRQYRLPTEAEWEYACRAGTESPYHFGHCPSPALANFDGRPLPDQEVAPVYCGRAVAVGSYPPNGFGLYDMHGNVWEWCQDLYDNTAYYLGSPASQGTWDEEGFGHVLRGGSWGDPAVHCRSAYRRNGGSISRHRDNRIGFRVALTIGRPRRRRKEGTP
jgi:uncharacterized protein (TIGR02996 family)